MFSANIKSHFLRNSGKAWKWYTQIFFIFKYFVQNKENRRLWIFFLKIPICSWETGCQILARFRQNWSCFEWNCNFEGQICCHEDDKNMSFDIFPKYGQNFIINVQKICLLTFCWLEIMARNYKIWKISWTLNLNITLWPLLAHRLLWFFWRSFGSTFIPWKKVSVQAMAWVWAMAWNSLFVQNMLLKITHNGVGLRSDIRRGGFLASSNIVL